MSREPARIHLELDPELAVEVLSDFIRDAVEISGMAGVVLGLSGGIDSALACALAVRALGPEGVHAFFMPHETSNSESRHDADSVATGLGFALTEIDITPMIEAYFSRIDPNADRIRQGNKMARERMSILFDQSKKLSCLVLGTSNKTEILLGYSTIFGDNASSINPLGDLYKQQVRALATHLALPPGVIEKAPSADLWPGQTDEDELGLSYDVADEILHLLFDVVLSPAEIVARGYPESTVERVVSLESANRFKRRLMLIARLSGSAINLDREIPRD